MAVAIEVAVTVLRIDVGEDEADDKDTKLEAVREEGADEVREPYPPPLAVPVAVALDACLLARSLAAMYSD